MATTTDRRTTEEVADHVFSAALGAFETLSIHLGDRLGWYRALADGPATAAELVARAGGDERYAQEWLEQQVTVTLLESPDGRSFRMSDAVAEVLTDTDSLSYLAPLARMIAASAAQMPSLVSAYRSGGGVGWSQFGEDMREAQADMNRPWFEQALGPAFAAVPEIHDVLARDGVQVADVGSGGGWSSIAIARAYPGAVVHGFDVDAPSVAMARTHAATTGLTDRVHFEEVDASRPPAEGAYDAVFAFECVHDMPNPVEVLGSIRRMVAPDGLVVIMDEAVGEHFTGMPDEIEQAMYGFSLFVCLPDGRAHPDSAATGTVMRPDTLRRYAEEAGFTDLEILPIEDFGFWRFYRLLG